MNYFMHELKRALTGKKTIFTAVLCLVCLILAGYDQMGFPSVDFIDIMMSALTDNTNAVLVLLFPILVNIPFSMSYREEVSSGMYPLIRNKMKFLTYGKVKLIVNMVCSLVTFMVPCAVYYIAVIFLKGTHLTEEVSHSFHFAVELYQNHPVLYGWILVFNTGVCGIVFSTLGLGISAWIRNKYIACLMPFCFYIFSGAVLIELNPYWNAITLYSINEYNNTRPGYILLYDVILLAAGIGLFISGCLRWEKKES